MKAKLLLGLVVALVVVLGTVPSALSLQAGIAPPTQAPTATPGLAAVTFPTSEVKPNPITSEEGAWQLALLYDGRFALRPDGGLDLRSFDTLLTNGDVTVEYFESRSAESADAGRNETFHAEVEAAAGPVWRVTIKGKAQVNLVGGDPDATYSQTVYVLSGNTGELLQVGAIP